MTSYYWNNQTDHQGVCLENTTANTATTTTNTKTTNINTTTTTTNNNNNNYHYILNVDNFGSMKNKVSVFGRMYSRNFATYTEHILLLGSWNFGI